MDDAHDVAPADRTFGESLATRRARDHVSTVKQQTVDDGIHAHLAHVALKRRRCRVRVFARRTFYYRHRKQ